MNGECFFFFKVAEAKIKKVQDIIVSHVLYQFVNKNKTKMTGMIGPSTFAGVKIQKCDLNEKSNSQKNKWTA